MKFFIKLSFILINMYGILYAQDFVIKAKKDEVNIFSEPSKAATILHTLKTNETIKAQGRKGMFWIVNIDKKVGYVYSLDVTRVSSSDDAIASSIVSLMKKTRDMDEVKSTRVRSGVMGVRGLQTSKSMDNAGNVKPNIRMVYMMEDRQINPHDIAKIANAVNKEIMIKLQKSQKN